MSNRDTTTLAQALHVTPIYEPAPTLNLRFVSRAIRDGGAVRILQQQWILTARRGHEIEDVKYEWRDVPLVTE